MNRRKLSVAGALGGAALVLIGGIALGGGKPPPPPPPKDGDAACSPGFIKNHPETWCNVTCPTGVTITDCESLLTALNATGAGAGALKQAAATFVNDTCYGTAEASPCDDDD